MKKIKKRIIPPILCLLICAILLPMQAAAENSINLNEKCSLCISFVPNGIKADDVEFKLYRVADISSLNHFELTDNFNSYPLIINDENQDTWRDLATTLSGFVYADNLNPDYVARTDDGEAIFKNVDAGLYLVIGASCTIGDRVYIPQSFIISLPNNFVNNQYEYNVYTDAKYDSYSKDDKCSMKVLKVWKDNDSSFRLEKVVVELYKESKLYDTVILSKDNNWRYEWKELDEGAVWTVKEKTVCDGYTVDVARQGNCFVVTNTSNRENDTENPTKPSNLTGNSSTLPQTGLLWWPVPILICSGLLLFIIGYVRRSGDIYEK